MRRELVEGHGFEEGVQRIVPGRELVDDVLAVLVEIVLVAYIDLMVSVGLERMFVGTIGP